MGAYNAILDTLVAVAPKIRRNPAESGGSWTILLRFTILRYVIRYVHREYIEPSDLHKV